LPALSGKALIKEKMKKHELFYGSTICLAFVFTWLLPFIAVGQIKISPSFYGLNFWHTDFGNMNTPTNTPTSTFDATYEWPIIQASGGKMIRIGGKGYDFPSSNNSYSAPHINDPTTRDVIPAGYVSLVDEVRSKGFEPVITVPFRDDHRMTIAAQADTAAEIVRVLNIVHKRSVK
jgi:hypothetical protein